MLSTLGNNFSRQHFEIFFLLFPENWLWHFMQIAFSKDDLHEMSKHIKQTICMKCQSLFSGKNKKNIINLLSAEFAQRVVKVKQRSLCNNCNKDYQTFHSTATACLKLYKKIQLVAFNARWCKISQWQINDIFLILPRKYGLTLCVKWEAVCMKLQAQFCGKNNMETYFNSVEQKRSINGIT